MVHTRQLPREGTEATSPASGSSLSKGFIRWRLQVSLCKVDRPPRGVTGCAAPGTPHGLGTSRRPSATRPAVCQEQVNSSAQGVARPGLRDANAVTLNGPRISNTSARNVKFKIKNGIRPCESVNPEEQTVVEISSEPSTGTMLIEDSLSDCHCT